MNLRFGGAFPLPLAAGGAYPALALALAQGERPEPRLGDYREGVVMARYLTQSYMTRVDGRYVPFAAPAADPSEDHRPGRA